MNSIRINHDSPVPLYYQLREQIRENILSGVWEYGKELPSELQLCETLELSRATVKQAMDGLVQEKLIERKKGKGTFVIYQNKGHNIFSEPSLTRQITSIGSEIYSRVLSVGEGPLEKKISGYFDDSPNSFFKLSRVRYVNNQPLAIETNYIRHEWAQGLSEQTLNKISVYQYLEDTYQMQFDNHHITVRPTLLNVEEKQLLGIEDERVQLIVFKKDIVGVHIGILSSCKGEKIMFTKRIFCGNHFQISVDYNPTTREYQIDSIRTASSPEK